MTSFTTVARNKVVDSIGINGGSDWFSLHSGDPSTGGSNEIAGIARKMATYPAAAGGESIMTGVTFDVPAGSSLRYFGRWSANEGGIFLCGGPLPGQEASGTPEVYAVNGQYQLTNKIVQGAA